MEINIISKNQVNRIVENEVRKSETRLLKIIDKLRERINTIENDRKMS